MLCLCVQLPVHDAQSNRKGQSATNRSDRHDPASQILSPPKTPARSSARHLQASVHQALTPSRPNRTECSSKSILVENKQLSRDFHPRPPKTKDLQTAIRPKTALFCQKQPLFSQKQAILSPESKGPNPAALLPFPCSLPGSPATGLRRWGGFSLFF